MKRISDKACVILLGSVLGASALMQAADVKGGADASKWIEDVGGVVVKDSAGHVTGADLRSSWVTDADLHKLADLPYLATLDLSNTRITDQGMQDLKSLTGIVDLNLYYAEYVTDEGLAAIKGWRKLKRLNLHGTKATDTTLEQIQGITTLESLNIGSIMVTDIGLERLVVLPNLKELTVGGNKLNDPGLQALRQMPKLTYLDFGGRQGTDANIWAVRMSDTGLAAVLTLKDLHELRFVCSTVGVGLEGTRFADIRYLSVTTEWLEKMKALPKLEKLKLQACDQVNDDSIRVLATMPSLKEVDLKGTSVTEKGLAALKAAKPGMKIYSGPWVSTPANYRNN